MRLLLAGWLETWAAIYAAHAAVRTAVVFAHIGGIALGGGAAMAADRTVLQAGPSPLEIESRLAALARTHRTVIGALGVVIASGILQFLSDTGTFLHSPIFWVKMGVVSLLLANGAWLRACGRCGDWGRLRISAAASLCLWLGAILAGTALLNS